ncbi:glycosyltransferase [Pontibacter burrus]|uniref:Glycosyltransferase family 4 protein n=1 Tax=Pontibacter burrus TaxID=2704466 RepID=A0A6B3LMW2_9BACT|nr:glycosyltransferase [Pontibacter burrus]NEM98262.1 glycosyltransferase family 4 protein [Pontibacter burrus]
MAGALAFKVWENIKVPFYVSLFEPHAEYMLESGVWSKFSLKYNLQKRWQELQKKHASGVMPVANNYKQTLLAEGIAVEKIRVVPCVADNLAFAFDPEKRAEARKQLNWQSATIGVYVGKYGGLYYDDEAFEVYRKCFELIPDFRLLILSPQAKEEIQQQLQKHKIDPKKTYIASVPHGQVPDYLTASDFAFATYKPGPSKKYLSPVKIGEYWANGLPVLLTEGIGDESDIIKKEGGGALFNLSTPGSLENAIEKIKAIVQDPTHRQEIPKLALKYRSVEMLRKAYDYFFNQPHKEA